ncbi:MAG TPA: autotransporter domain-containing protein, partial [Bradyrhizobium sp.]|nr:autotransporter domain-containing protein [Bradyrhizobium sp.]
LQWLSGFTSNRNITLNAGGGTLDTNGNNATLGGTISGSGGLTKTGLGLLSLSGSLSYTGATTVNGGTLSMAGTLASAVSATTINTGGTLVLGGPQTINAVQLAGGTIQNGSLTGAINSSGGTIDSIGGSARVTTTSGTTTLIGANTYSGGTNIAGGTVAASADDNLGSLSNGLDFAGGTLRFLSGFSTGRTMTLNAGGGTLDTNGNNATLGGTIAGTGGLTKTGAGTLTLAGINNYTGATTINGGTLATHLPNGGLNLAGGATLRVLSTVATNGAATLNGAGGIVDTNGNDLVLAGTISGSGSLTKTGSGTLTLVGADTHTGATTINGGTLESRLNGAGLSVDGGTLRVLSSAVSNGNVTLGAGGGTFKSSGFNTTLGGTISGPGGLSVAQLGTLTLSGNNTYAGGTEINGDATLAVSRDQNLGLSGTRISFDGGALRLLSGLTSNREMTLNAGGGTVIFRNSGGGPPANATLGGVISGPGGLSTDGFATLTLAAINTYSGPTNVRGALIVDGSIASSSLTTVDGILSGTGTVGATLVTSNGFLRPGKTAGTSLTIAGNLAFQSGAQYVVQLNSQAATSAHVTGTASLNGDVSISFKAANLLQQYTILTATGGITGAFSSAALSSEFITTLSYDAHNVFLNVTPLVSADLNGNQHNIAATLADFFERTGSIPGAFASLSRDDFAGVSGESAVGSQQATFSAMNQFMGVLSDRFIAGRDGLGLPSSQAMPFADESAGASSYAADGKARSKSEREAYAMFAKARPALTYEPRWSVWAAGFGGSQTTDGNNSVGSNTATSRIFGTAVGADYSFSANTIAGFALAGGGTNFSVANGFGGGRSDLFQAGAFVRHTAGAAYLSGALAYGWQDVITDRTVTVAGVDRLRGEFNAHAFSGRLEGGYRFLPPRLGGVGLTPYAAGQFTAFNLPAYAEGVVSGVDTFALAYNSKSVTASRSEIGVRSEKSFPMPDSILTLRGRAAWAHDFNRDRSVAATFQTLPGASFIVSGAAPAPDAALVTASAERKWQNGWSAAATFESEFSEVTRSYAGKAMVRYAF